VGEFLMPALGADMTHGTLMEWLVKPGDTVKRGDIVAVVDTAKAEIDVEIFEDGVIEQLLVPVGTRVPVGTALAEVRASDAAAKPQVAPVDGAAGERLRVTPVARRMAAQLGVDLATIRGTGAHGAIGKEDVERATAGAVGAPATPERVAPRPEADGHLPALRAATAALMARSKREVPHYYLALDIDVKDALAWMHERNSGHPIAERMLPAALLLGATARAATDFPDMNGFWRDDALEPSADVHLGVAIALPGGGVIAPAILDAAGKRPWELMTELRDLVKRARSGGLRARELSGGTITVTSLGDQAATSIYGVIYPPQVALVGFGRVSERPWAENGMVGARAQVTATLSGDHRASTGQRGALFLAAIDTLLQRPEEL
jgi:pyruvate dehydrogenase E2 component (dihydrolipoamide acetyltransferase)